MHPLATAHGLISDQVTKQEISIILRELELVLRDDIPGEVVEFGCYVGTTSLFIQRLLKKYPRQFHVYDSFEGLPEKTTQDQSPAGEQFRTGELHTTKQTFVQNFKKANLRPPFIHRSWFSNLTTKDVPETICFAFLDGDYYESIRDSLRLIQDKLSAGATIVVDDYLSEALPGAKKAIDEWLITHAHHRLKNEAGMAIIRDGREDHEQ